MYKSDDRLATLINDLVDSKNVHTIKMPKEGEGNSNITKGLFGSWNEKNGKGASSETRYGPDITESQGEKRDPKVGLVHELQHAHDKDKGVMDRSASETGVKNSEERAVRTENIMRDAVGDDRRTEYGDKKVSDPANSPLSTPVESDQKASGSTEAAKGGNATEPQSPTTDSDSKD